MSSSTLSRRSARAAGRVSSRSATASSRPSPTKPTATRWRDRLDGLEPAGDWSAAFADARERRGPARLAYADQVTGPADRVVVYDDVNSEAIAAFLALVPEDDRDEAGIDECTSPLACIRVRRQDRCCSRVPRLARRCRAHRRCSSRPTTAVRGWRQRSPALQPSTPLPTGSSRSGAPARRHRKRLPASSATSRSASRSRVRL